MSAKPVHLLPQLTVIPVSNSFALLRLPVKTESEANEREHWAKRHRRRASQRAIVGLALRSLIVRKPQLPCVVRITRIAPRALDKGDNLAGSLKAVRDEVAKWLGINDGGDAVQWEYAQCRHAPRTYGIEIAWGDMNAVARAMRGEAA